MSWLHDLLNALGRRRPADPIPTPSPGPVPATTPPPEVPDPVGLRAAINLERARLGLAALTAHPELDRVAAGWAGEMARTRTLSHADAASRIAGVLPNAASGETIAMGQGTARAAVADWLASPGHRAILTGNYGLIGTGSAADARGSIYWCADFAKL